MHRWIVPVVATLVLSVGAQPQSLRRHSGTTIDIATKRPIVAKVHAFASATNRHLVDGCVAYDKELQATQSLAPTGAFELQIPAELTSYVVSYCQPGYFGRVEEFNENTPDGVPVASAPIELQANSTDPNTVARALQDDLMRVGATLAYLKAANGVNYDKIIGTASVGLPGIDLGTLAAQLDPRRRGRAAGGS